MTDDKATTVGREHKDKHGQWKDVVLMKRISGLGVYHIRPLDGILYTGQQCLSEEEKGD